MSDDGNFDADLFKNWAQQVRHLCNESQLLNVGDYYIGHFLSHSPKDNHSDNLRLHPAVGEIMELLASDQISEGFVIGND